MTLRDVEVDAAVNQQGHPFELHHELRPQPPGAPLQRSQLQRQKSDSSVSDLHSEIEGLVARHRTELCVAVDAWVQRQKLELDTPVSPARPSSMRSTSGLTDMLASSQDKLPSLSPPHDVAPAKLPIMDSDAVQNNTWTMKAWDGAPDMGADASESRRGGGGAGGARTAFERSRSKQNTMNKIASADRSASKVMTVVPSAASFSSKHPKSPDGRHSKHRKFRRVRKKAGSYLTQSKREQVLKAQTALQRLTSNRWFELSTVMMIVSNAAFIGYQAQYIAVTNLDLISSGQPPMEAEPTGFIVIQVMFVLLFLCELILRWTADGFVGFFQTQDLHWNAIDVFVVFLSLCDLCSLVWPLFSDQNLTANTSSLRILRVVRIIRVARVIRIARFFRELRMMIFALLGCMKSLLWALVILLILFFMFGISITTGTTDLLVESSDRRWLEPKYQELLASFGTLDRSVLTLYMSMSGGRDWGEIYDELRLLALHHRLAFLMFISFALFAVVNIVTGIFVDSAFQCNANDREIIVEEELAAKEKYLHDMRTVFEEIDDDNTGNISMEEFEKKLDDEHVIAYFQALKLDVSEAKQLFRLLDFDQSGEISVEEFLEGCHKLKGESRALDMAIMQYEVRWVADQIDQLTDFTQRSITDMCKAMNVPVRPMTPPQRISTGLSVLEDDEANSF